MSAAAAPTTTTTTTTSSAKAAADQRAAVTKDYLEVLEYQEKEIAEKVAAWSAAVERRRALEANKFTNETLADFGKFSHACDQVAAVDKEIKKLGREIKKEKKKYDEMERDWLWWARKVRKEEEEKAEERRKKDEEEEEERQKELAAAPGGGVDLYWGSAWLR